MDSLSQVALGAAVGVAVMGRKTALWKAAVMGAVVGTLPDLDVLINHGDPIRDMTLHRTESHALFYLTLAAPLIAWITAKLAREMDLFKHWWLAVWLVLITHPLLDTMTIYGTQLALPFSDYPFGIGSVFVIDPLYTLPLLLGTGVALARKQLAGLRWNTLGLAISSAYLMWGLAMQFYVGTLADKSLTAQGISAQQRLVTAAPFNSVLWRVVAITPSGYAEGFYSLLDDDRNIQFIEYPRGEHIYNLVRSNWEVNRIAWFSKGYFKMEEKNGVLSIADLRMGVEPYYSFTFDIATRTRDEHGERILFTRPKQPMPDIQGADTLHWFQQRFLGDTDQSLVEFLKGN
ncbi:metal-dependent hydrolase [Cellvibrio fontiphilus]|uniref:Metal-dependent hydrolase n=1 Tax=Cellvibrio fontiphilus TaxID=1815559 RepID=A0ABV7FDI7_9GAMM